MKTYDKEINGKSFKYSHFILPCYTDKIIYSPRNNFRITFYNKNTRVLMDVISFPACCGIGLVDIIKMSHNEDLMEILKSIISITGYSTLFIIPNNIYRDEIKDKLNSIYVKELNL